MNTSTATRLSENSVIENIIKIDEHLAKTSSARITRAMLAAGIEAAKAHPDAKCSTEKDWIKEAEAMLAWMDTQFDF